MNSIIARGWTPAVLTVLTAAPAHPRPQCPVPSAGADIVAGQVFDVGNYDSLDGLEALSFGATACNVGDTPLDTQLLTPDTYILAQHLYRLKDYGGWSALEQVGLSWVRHEICTLNESLCCDCVPTSCSTLGVGCSYPVGPNLNASQAQMGGRWQVDATTAVFPNPPANPPFAGSTARRLEVQVADLEPTATTTTRYFGELHFLTPDDAAAGNGHNNAGYREVALSGSGDAWNFGPLLGVTERETPAIFAWQAADASVAVRDILLPLEGRLVLAHRVTDLGGGTWHYEYALYNMNSHDSVRSFSIPVGSSVSVSGIGFHDVAYRNGDGEASVDFDGTDWPGVQRDDALSWATETFAQNANANALRWGTTYNFRFDADVPPTSGSVTLIRYRSETAHVVGSILVPSAPEVPAFCDASDGSLAACPCSNPGAPNTGCDNARGTGGVAASVTSQDTGALQATLLGAGFPPATAPTAIVIRGNNVEPTPVVFFDGVRCVGLDGFARLGATAASAGTSTHTFGHGAGPGTYYYQIWYRNTPLAFCDSTAAANVSNGRSLTW